MYRIEFTDRLPYRYLDDHRTPVVLVRLRLNRQDYEFLCLVDTGAERSLFDGRIVHTAGIDLFSGTPRRVGGFLGGSVVTYEHPAQLSVNHLSMDLPVLFSTQPLPRQVVGRDVLTHFVMALREHTSELFLSAEEV